jgi:hypothetical protein
MNKPWKEILNEKPLQITWIKITILNSQTMKCVIHSVMSAQKVLVPAVKNALKKQLTSAQLVTVILDKIPVWVEINKINVKFAIT